MMGVTKCQSSFDADHNKLTTTAKRESTDDDGTVVLMQLGGCDGHEITKYEDLGPEPKSVQSMLVTVMLMSCRTLLAVWPVMTPKRSRDAGTQYDPETHEVHSLVVEWTRVPLKIGMPRVEDAGVEAHYHETLPTLRESK